MKGIFFDPDFVIGEKRQPLNSRLAKTIFAELEEFTGMPIEKLSEMYWQDKTGADKEAQDRIDNLKSPKDVLNYYRTTSQYLYELGYWEAQKDKQQEFKKLYLFCKKFGIKHILDYGGGIGGLSIYLNRGGISCDYLDIPGKTFDFAKFRFIKRGLKVRTIDGSNEALCEKYDAVICYDVLEHVFDLEKTIKTINCFLSEGGFFIHRSTFGTGGIHLKKHAMYQNFDRFNRFLKSFGFEFAGRIKPDYPSDLIQGLGLRYALSGIRLSKKMKYGGNFLLHKKLSSPRKRGRVLFLMNISSISFRVSLLPGLKIEPVPFFTDI